MTIPTFSGYLVDLSKPKEPRLDWSDMDKQFTPGQRVIWTRKGFSCEAEVQPKGGLISPRDFCAIYGPFGFRFVPSSELTPAESLPVQGEPFGYLIVDSFHNTQDFTRERPEWHSQDETIIGLYTHPPAQPVQVPDEREAFENWALGDGPFFEVATYKDGCYKNTDLALCWTTWQARALLAASQSADQHRIEVLEAVSEEYNHWIRFHAAGDGDYDDFIKKFCSHDDASKPAAQSQEGDAR